MTWTRSAQDTLELSVDALALLVLRDYQAAGGWNWRNWMRAAEQNGTASEDSVGRALAEAWGWLMTHGLVAPDPSQSSADAYFVTRLGEQALKVGTGQLEAAQRLGRSLHPRIAAVVQRQFLLGEYELAVFAAMKAVEVRVRELAGAPDSLLGTSLMQAAFGSTGPLTDSDAEPGERVALMELFKGAIGTLKNPASHRPVAYEDPGQAADAISLANLLHRALDQVELRQR